MARPRIHGERTAAELIDAAERIVETEGLEALSVRLVASEVGATTRAVYSLFASKDGLVVALGTRAFDLLGAAVAELPVTTNPSRDLVLAGLTFRRFAREHPALFRLAVQRKDLPLQLGSEFAASADRALGELRERVIRLYEAEQLGDRSIEDAVWEFHAMCEGLAAVDARCSAAGLDSDRVWEDALTSLIRGWSAGPH